MSSRNLRFFADASCDFAVVRAIREAGFDVVAMSQVTHHSDDREKRILLTEDKDFGWLVFVSHASSAGVVLKRCPDNARQALAESVRRLAREKGEELLRSFVVVQPGYVHIGRKLRVIH